MATPGTRSRIFVGLSLPEAVRTPLGEYLGRCAQLAPEQRWAPAANLHLTLHFLGWASPDEVARVAEALAAVRRPAFSLRLGGLGRFGSPARPRVLWLGVGASGREPLSALAADVAAACARAGLPGDERPYRPHLTLCRVRPGATLPALAEPPPLPAWVAGSFVLFESRSGPRGAVYTPLREFPLGALEGHQGDPE